MTTWLFFWHTTRAQYAGENKGENKSHKAGHKFFFFLFAKVWLLSHGIKGQHWPFHLVILLFSPTCFPQQTKADFASLFLSL